MKRTRPRAILVAASFAFLSTPTFAQSAGEHHGPGHGPMMGQGMGSGHGGGAMMGRGMGRGSGSMPGAVAMLTRQDENSAADMGLVHELLDNHTAIRRTVTKLPNGIKTVTESDDPKVAQAIKAHVASMSLRLKEGREFNIFSRTLPVIFAHADKIASTVELTDKGAIVTRTAADPELVAALHGHAGEVTELVNEGHTAMHRGMQSRMAMGAGAPRGGRASAPANGGQHMH